MINQPALVDDPVEDAQAIDARWDGPLREIQRVPLRFLNAAMFGVTTLMVVLAVATFIGFLVTSNADPAVTNSTYPKSLLAATKDIPYGLEFTEVKQLLENFFNSPPLVDHPHSLFKKQHMKNLKNNPSPPTLQISSGVLASEQPILTDDRACVPLSCSSTKTLRVDAMDSNTTDEDVNEGKNSLYPNLTPIHTSNLHLCCGTAINSAVTTPFKLAVQYHLSYLKCEYITTGHCQLVSDIMSPQPQIILPTRVLARCR
eukprot:768773_1